jgi:hypothetical protein
MRRRELAAVIVAAALLLVMALNVSDILGALDQLLAGARREARFR